MEDAVDFLDMIDQQLIASESAEDDETLFDWNGGKLIVNMVNGLLVILSSYILHVYWSNRWIYIERGCNEVYVLVNDFISVYCCIYK